MPSLLGVGNRRKISEMGRKWQVEMQSTLTGVESFHPSLAWGWAEFSGLEKHKEVLKIRSGA
ncbi:hypothetical protein VM1G_11482 [Cytospora mali]|uniref:Uncharacterized protein n=1 Tax=Cytospora mali TaxID=578113 RepID=A0A194VUP9_CYTMA|nr:hypothetical protein VM1G_11482 [Valsa mali]